MARKKLKISNDSVQSVKMNILLKAVGSQHIDYPSTKECRDIYESNKFTDKVSYKKKDTDLIMQGKNFLRY